MSEKPGLGHKEETWTTWNAQHGMESIAMDFKLWKGLLREVRESTPLKELRKQLDMGLNAVD